MEWSYSGNTGPDNWAKLYTAACGSRQSPIDIETDCLTPHCAHTGQRLTWRYPSNELHTVKNTGHSWQISADNSMSEVSGGPLNCDYELSQVHCHWGEDDAEGSEHTVNGKHYPAELHLVHWNKTNYCSVEEATKHPDGLCVFAVFLKVGNTHHELQKVVEKIPDIIHKGDRAKLSTPLNIQNILPKEHAYWSYMGSLTTPPCWECVIWIIFNEPIEVSHEQLEAFRTLRCHPADMCQDINCCDGQLKHNYRPTAPRGERVIVASDS